HVRGTQIAMQDTMTMGMIDGVANLTRVVERLGDVECPVPEQNRIERFARDELHHDEEHVVLLLGRENRDDVRMIQCGKKARLSQQLAEVDTLLVWNLERDFLVDPRVFCEIDGAEATAADR